MMVDSFHFCVLNICKIEWNGTVSFDKEYLKYTYLDKSYSENPFGIGYFISGNNGGTFKTWPLPLYHDGPWFDCLS